MNTSYATRYAKSVIRYRWIIIAVSVVAVFLASSGARFLEPTNDYRVFFDEANPQLKAFEALQDTYDKSDNVLIVISPKDGQVFSQKTLSSVQWITERAWQTPFSSRVDSVTNYQHTEAIEDDLVVADLVGNTASLSISDLDRIRNIAVNEPALLKRLINKDASVTAVNITVQLPGKVLDEVPTVATFVRQLALDLEAKDPNLTVRLTGVVMMNASFGEASLHDIATLVPLMFLVVIVVLGLLMRSISTTFATLLLILMSIFTAMGLFGWSGFKLTPPSMSAPTIILTMAVADAVHLLVSFLWGMRHGMPKHEAMIESIRINLLPIFLTSLTTALGFLSMNFAAVPPLAHLGNVVAMGVVVAFILSMTFLPALVVVLPVKVKITSDKEKTPNLERFGYWVVQNRKVLLFSMLTVAVFFVAFIPKNEINDEFVKYFDESVPFRADTDYASEKLISPYTIEFSIKSGEAGGISEPAYLQKVDAFVDHLNSYDLVSHVFTFSNTMKRLNQNMHGNASEKYVLPESRELSAQFLLLYEMSLPYGLDLNNQIDVDKSSTRLTMTTKNLSSAQVLTLEESINVWVNDNLSEYEVDAASPNLMFAHIGMTNSKSLLLGTCIALFFISIILIVALRSLKIGMISLIPNLVPVGIAFGIWGLIDGQIGMSVSIVAGMTLGIVVDDTVHFLSKYLRAKREKGLNAQEACLYAFTHVGQALIVTTFVLVTGFLVLSMSTFKMNGDMGLLTAMTIAIALVVDFLLLPPLLIWLDKKDTQTVNT